MSRAPRWLQLTMHIVFVVGLISAPVWCRAQILKSFTTTSGISLAQYITFELSFALGFTLAYRAWRAKPGTIILEQVIVLLAWSIGGAILVGVVLFGVEYHWTQMDTLIATLSLLGFITITIWAIVSHRSLADDAVRAWNVMFLKALPQFLLAGIILMSTSGGLTATAIIMGHVSICARLTALSASTIYEGANRSKWWLIISEVANELSWITVTIAWYLKL